MKTAEDILQAQKCGDIFEWGSKQHINAQYKELARIYHPDIYKGNGAKDIMAKINKLHKEAMDLLNNGAWEASNEVLFVSREGERSKLTYKKKFRFELGTEYVARSHLFYCLDGKHKKFFDNATYQSREIFSVKIDKKIDGEFSKHIPPIEKSFVSKDGTYCIGFKKPIDVVPLRLLLNYYNGSIPDVHVAWMISRLLNLACLFQYKGIAHNGLTIENLYVNPFSHSIYPYGGWWYAQTLGRKLLGVPKFVYDVMPPKEKGEKISSTRTDIETIKGTASILLGKNDAPQEFLDFLNSGSSDNAIEEFQKWSTALDKAYGKRRFIRMDITIDELYK